MGAIYLIRHGQASFGSEDYDALSELGFRQARVLGEALRRRIPRVDAVFCGTLRRQRDTATACLDSMGLAGPPATCADFNEFDHDELIRCHTPRYATPGVLTAEMDATGDPQRAFQAMFNDAFARWIGGADDSAYAEPWSGFRSRCLSALDRAAAALGSERTVLAFTSGGVIAVVCQALLGIPDSHVSNLTNALANCGVSKVVVGSKGRYLSTFNEHGHFEGAARDLLTYR
jgi:broad specificity phosphatase PhoE